MACPKLQLTDEIFRRSCGEHPVEMKNQKMSDTEVADERDLVLRRRD